MMVLTIVVMSSPDSGISELSNKIKLFVKILNTKGVEYIWW